MIISFARQYVAITAFVLSMITSALPSEAAPKRLLIVGQGPDGHPRMTHEFMAGANVLAELLKPHKDVQTTVVNSDEPWSEGPGLIDQADGIVMLVTQGARWMQMTPERHAALKRLAARGGAIVALHWSVGAVDPKYIQGQLDVLGATRGGPQRKYRELETELKRAAPGHPIVRRVGDIKVFDEIYYSLDRVPGIRPIFLSEIDGKAEPAAWCWERPDGGRSFGFVGLHFHANWQIPDYRRFVTQAVLWSLKLPVPEGGVNVDIDSTKLEIDGALPPPAGPAKEKKPAKSAPAASAVNVILWFDTEDYLLLADDDATKRLCMMLTERGIRATFKLVGEKARVLELRGRRDVIAALKKHDIGYHSDFHSVHPTPTEYLADCGWLDGVEEFARREGDGAADVRRILGVSTLACYGQPGSSWGPQTLGALKQIGVAPHGIPCYVDEGNHVGLDNKPFWYANVLNVYHMGQNYTRMELHNPDAVQPAKTKVTEIADRLRAEGGGVISIFYHPCEWVHKQFWDGVNFARGANPPREQWKAPPQRTAQETEAAFKRFAEYIDHIRQIPGVRWITASDLPVLYPDLVRTEGASAADLDEMARRILSNGWVDFQRIGSRAYSVADQFELLTRAVNDVIDGRAPVFPLKAAGLLGPDRSTKEDSPTSEIKWPAFRDAARDVHQFIQTEHRVPARVFIGPDPMPPADFLRGLAAAWSYYRVHGKLPVQDGITVGRHVRVLPERHVAEDTPDLFGGWIIHREGFRAPKVMEQARLQAWTLKPALAAP